MGKQSFKADAHALTSAPLALMHVSNVAKQLEASVCVSARLFCAASKAASVAVVALPWEPDEHAAIAAKDAAPATMGFRKRIRIVDMGKFWLRVKGTSAKVHEGCGGPREKAITPSCRFVILTMRHWRDRCLSSCASSSPCFTSSCYRSGLCGERVPHQKARG